jgi:hypothetical protein
LLSYRWQAGGLVARRISESEYERERESLGLGPVLAVAPAARVKGE